MMNLTPESLRLLPRSEREELLTLLEECRRRELRSELEGDLIKFIRYFFAARGMRFIVNEHHHQIAETIGEIEAGIHPNTVINIAPRYGKTEEVVIGWIAWSIARNARAKFIHLSYSAELALENSTRAREIVKSREFQELWPVKLKADSDSKAKWYTEQGGGVYATAAASAVTGFGAGVTGSDAEAQEKDDFDLEFLDSMSAAHDDAADGKFNGAILIDDPLKVDDAKSESERRKVNDRLNSTIKSRRNSRKTPIVIVMQRLHEEDMSGFVLSGGMGETFHHLKIKTLRDDGTALWPLKHTSVELEEMRTGVDRLNFASQYQQEPVPSEGLVYKLPWFQRYSSLPDPSVRTMIVHSWDTAVKANELNDPSVCTVWHLTPTLWYLAEVHRGKWEYPELRRRVFALANDQKPNVVLIEDKGSGQQLLQEFKQASMHAVIGILPLREKRIRAETEAALVESGRVALPNVAHWLTDYEAEMMLFPNGKHDDQVDSTSQFLRWMRERGGGNDAFKNMMERLYGN